jgi:hypothetical protein
MQISTTTMENSMEAIQKIKNRTTIWSNNSTPRDVPEYVSQITIKAPAHLGLLQYYS